MTPTTVSLHINKSVSTTREGRGTDQGNFTTWNNSEKENDIDMGLRGLQLVLYLERDFNSVRGFLI